MDRTSGTSWLYLSPMAVPRHRFHSPSYGVSGEWDRASALPLNSSHGTAHMFRLRSSRRCAVLSLLTVTVVLGSALLWLSAAHSSLGFLFTLSDAVAVSADGLSVDILTPNRRYPPSELAGTEAGIDFITSHILFFLHIPKTAGQSFTTALTIATEPYRPILNARLIAAGNLSASSKMNRPRKGGGRRLDLAFMQREETYNLLKPDRHAAFLSLFTNRALVFGHTDVLIARQFESDGRHVEFITMLRSPEERVLSHYCYMLTTWQEAKRHRLVYPSWFAFLAAKAPDAIEALPPLPTPPDAIDSPPALHFPNVSSYPVHQQSPASFVYYYRSTPLDRIDNWHTRAYSGCLHTPMPTTPQQDIVCNSTQLMLAEAKRQLRSFLFVGLTEHYNQSVALLNYTLNTDVEPTSPSAALADGSGSSSQPPTVLLASTAHGQRLSANSRMGTGQRRKVARVLNRNRQKSTCVSTISGNDTVRMEQMMDEVRLIEWMDMRLYDYATKLFWARVEEVERIRPGFTIPHPNEDT